MATSPADQRWDEAHNLFFAIFAPAELAQAVSHQAAVWRVAHGLGHARLQAPERLHLSLHIAYRARGPVPADVLALAREVGDRVRCPPFEVELDWLMSFRTGRSKYPLVLVRHDPAGNPGLHLLHQRLGWAMADRGWRPQPRFVPHMTLMYATTPLEGRAVEPVRWTCGELRLIDSHVGLSHYETRGTWPLVA